MHTVSRARLLGPLAALVVLAFLVPPVGLRASVGSVSALQFPTTDERKEFTISVGRDVG